MPQDGYAIGLLVAAGASSFVALLSGSAWLLACVTLPLAVASASVASAE